jgi:hypothetical protein
MERYVDVPTSAAKQMAASSACTICCRRCAGNTASSRKPSEPKATPATWCGANRIAPTQEGMRSPRHASMSGKITAGFASASRTATIRSRPITHVSPVATTQMRRSVAPGTVVSVVSFIQKRGSVVVLPMYLMVRNSTDITV